jgi:drug/metabolite transporter (DMT)-like permease
MLALIAAILFAIAFVLNAAGISTDPVFAPLSLAFVGLALLAFHLTGRGPELRDYSSYRRRRR